MSFSSLSDLCASHKTNRRDQIFWWEDKTGETRPFRFYCSYQSATPPPRPQKESERAKFVEQVDRKIRVYTVIKGWQVSTYGQAIADEYLVGHEPPGVVEEARTASERRRIAEIEATDSEDLRMPARMGMEREREKAREKEKQQAGQRSPGGGKTETGAPRAIPGCRPRRQATGGSNAAKVAADCGVGGGEGRGEGRGVGVELVGV